MDRKVIAGFNATDPSRDALAFGALLARATGAELVVAWVVTRSLPYGPGSEAHEAAAREHAETLLLDATAGLEGISTSVRAVAASSAARGLHDLAAEERVGVIALGSSHRGTLGRVLAGSVAERLLHGAPCAVTVAPLGFRERAEAGLRVIEVGFDSSPESRAALAYAASLAEATGATLRLVAVHEPNLFFGPVEMPARDDHGELLRSEREALEHALAEALAGLPAAVRAQGAVKAGSAPELLVSEAEKGVDLLVVGSRGYGPLRRVLLGGVSARLMREAPCPVLALPRGDGGGAS